jgi:deoxyribodipyrimidine photo-lyase
LHISLGVRRFTAGLAADALGRWGGEGPVTSNGGALADWAEMFDAVVAPYAPTGPVQDALDALPFPTVRPLRAWDATAWLHSTAGFFKVKKATTRILGTIPADVPD